MEIIRYNQHQGLLRNSDSFSQGIDNFRQRMGMKKILGIVGSSDFKRMDEYEEVRNWLMYSFDRARDRVGDFGVVCGGTKGGIPELAIRVAKENGLFAIGVCPEDGEKYLLESVVDLAVMIPRPLYGNVTWGSETPVLASLADGLVVAGGGWGTLVEVATVMKRNKSLKKHGERMVPVTIIASDKGLPTILRRDLLGEFACLECVSVAVNKQEFSDMVCRSLE